MNWYYTISVFIHILSAVIWIGGMIFIAMIVVPVTRKPLFENIKTPLIQTMGERFRTVGWICLALFLITGYLNIGFKGLGWDTIFYSAFWKSYFGRVLHGKLMLFGIILILSAIHDFVIGPKATRILQQNSADPKGIKLRKSASWFARINLLLALAAAFFGIMLVRGAPW